MNPSQQNAVFSTGTSGEPPTLSMLTNYNVERTDLGTISADLSGRPPGPLDSLDRDRYWRREGEGRDERENKMKETDTVLWAECDGLVRRR